MNRYINLFLTWFSYVLTGRRIDVRFIALSDSYSEYRTVTFSVRFRMNNNEFWRRTTRLITEPNLDQLTTAALSAVTDLREQLALKRSPIFITLGGQQYGYRPKKGT